MKIISQAWRTYKSKLVKCWRNKLNSFNHTKSWEKKTGKDLFQSANRRTLPWTVSTCSSSDRRTSLTTTSATLVILENRGSGNKSMTDWPNKVLRIHMTNFVDGWHHLCVLVLSCQSQAMSASTARAPRKWLKGPWGRAVKTQMVKGKMMPLSRLYKPRSNEAMLMKNDALIKALQTKEQWGHAHGVSSKLTWKEDFTKYKSTYRKRKMISTPHVDVEELKRQLRRKLLGDLKPILESQGIQFCDIAGVMSEEEHRSSLASTMVAPNTTKPIDQVLPGGGRP
jgi:hypothetical protein